MRKKVEETCSAATEYIHAVEEEAIFFESVFTNQDIKVKPEDLKLYPWNPKLRVYIRVYFPELFPQLAALDVVALKVRTLYSHFLKRIGEKPMNALLDDYLMDTAKVNNEFEEAFTSLLAGIQAEARKYTGPEALRIIHIREHIAKLWKPRTGGQPAE
jgi:hypothetical protein